MEYQDSLQDSKGVNAETDSDGIPEYEQQQHSDVINSAYDQIDKQDANVGSLLDALKMHNEELKE